MSIITKEALARLREWVGGLTDRELRYYGQVALKLPPSEKADDRLMWGQLRILLGDEMNRRSALRKRPE